MLIARKIVREISQQKFYQFPAAAGQAESVRASRFIARDLQSVCLMYKIIIFISSRIILNVSTAALDFKPAG